MRSTADRTHDTGQQLRLTDLAPAGAGAAARAPQRDLLPASVGTGPCAGEWHRRCSRPRPLSTLRETGRSEQSIGCDDAWPGTPQGELTHFSTVPRQRSALACRHHRTALCTSRSRGRDTHGRQHSWHNRTLRRPPAHSIAARRRLRACACLFFHEGQGAPRGRSSGLLCDDSRRS